MSSPDGLGVRLRILMPEVRVSNPDAGSIYYRWKFSVFESFQKTSGSLINLRTIPHNLRQLGMVEMKVLKILGLQ